jgi:hypothetical protein
MREWGRGAPILGVHAIPVGGLVAKGVDVMSPERSDFIRKLHDGSPLPASEGTQQPESGRPSGDPLHENSGGNARSLEAIRVCLLSSSYASIRNLDCYYDDDGLVISGTVPSYYVAQLAQELVRGLGQTQRIVNFVRVEYGTRSSGQEDVD